VATDDRPKSDEAIDIDDRELLKLRDKFAGEIATGIVMNRAEDSLAELSDNAMEVAAAAYLLADKMMEVRRFPIAKVRKLMQARSMKHKVSKTKPT
jgi:non-ribosomal peptide synthetase component E (peptide arylation enzyme)